MTSIVPGHGYYCKLDVFMEQHLHVGELYIEFIKMTCSDEENTPCDFCGKGWVGPELQWGPIPYPDYDCSGCDTFHYMPMKNIPRELDGKTRPPGDFQRRAQMRKIVKNGTLASKDTDSIKDFSKKYIVSEKIVCEYLVHLETLQLQQSKRQNSKEQAKQSKERKCYTDYNWLELHRSGNLRKLYSSELDKYLIHTKMQNKTCLSKKDKISWVEAHIDQQLFKDLNTKHDQRIALLNSVMTQMKTQVQQT